MVVLSRKKQTTASRARRYQPSCRRRLMTLGGASRAGPGFTSSAAYRTGQLEDRQVHGDDQTTHRSAKEQHQQRLHHRRQVAYRIVDLIVVEVGNLVEH